MKATVFLLAMFMGVFQCRVHANDYPYDSDCAYYRSIYKTADSWYAAPGLNGTVCTAGADPLGFCKCECTSYAAFRLNGDAPLLGFNNGYGGLRWSDAQNWDNKAKAVGVSVDGNPYPGDIAYWNAGDYGHVVYVKNVSYNTNGNSTSVDLEEYNYFTDSDHDHTYDSRTVNMSDANKPNGYIHFLDHVNDKTVCVNHNNGNQLCWITENNSVSCQNGTGYYFDNTSSGVCMQASRSDCTGIYGSIQFAPGGFGGGSAGLPDYIIKKVWLEDLNGVIKTVFNPGEATMIKVLVKNIGEDSPAMITIEYRQSKGLYEDDHHAVVGTDLIHKDDLKAGMTSPEQKHMTAPTTPGTYNVTVCADSIHDIIEKNESNNCSNEAVFTVNVPIPIQSITPILYNFLLD